MEILEVVSAEDGEQVTVSLRGELDLSTVGKVQEELNRAEASDATVVVLDLSNLTFLDSTGLRAVVTAHERAAEQGRRVHHHPAGGTPGDGRRRLEPGVAEAPPAA